MEYFKFQNLGHFTRQKQKRKKWKKTILRYVAYGKQCLSLKLAMLFV